MSRHPKTKRLIPILILVSITFLLTSCQNPVCQGSKISYLNTNIPMSIMSCGSADVHQLAGFFTEINPNIGRQEIYYIAELYITESAFEGINHDIAFCQMCLETNYLRFGGDVKRSQNNFCGLGATGAGATGLSFKSMEIGVRAHIQHLKAYATTLPLNRKLVDPRFSLVRRGSGRFVDDLTSRWATDPFYGTKIKNKLKNLAKFL